ncbi:uncharacterized protein LOC110450522 [Mizuhopecten yessoensis]|uniref:uncharacterized protein LOC110450522 n=1 Tax=Mizuhopecten yessoensis TaxID=6573 RepID=UPI000B45AF21|nr:uncharacterized protein LOC110450522 [Mizuhopecten yessoensis]
MTALLNEETLKQDLGKFPSTFDFDSTNLTKDGVKSTIRKLEDDRKHTRKLDTEDIQINNFLSYLYFVLGNYKHADAYIEESLQKDPENITANANKARFLLETGKISDVEDIIIKLQKLERREDYYKRKCYAEADLAYAYARSGPWYHQKAVDLYTRVLEAYPTEYAWKFGLGLALFRQTHRFISQTNAKLNPRENEKTAVHSAELFLTVATESDDPNLRANAYARLGRAVFNISKNNYTNVPDEIMRLQPKEYFEKAVEICPEEPSVLETCGQYARYRGELDTSEKLLRKSLQIKPTCQAYHHLALTLKRRVEISRSDAHNKGAYNFSLGANGDRRGGRYKSGSGQKASQNVQGGYGRYGSSCKRDSQNGNRRQKGPSRECMSDKSERTRRNLRQMIKSPLKVPVYPGNKHLSEAMELLEKAEELSEYALNKQYDKGMICRMLGQIEKAVEVFKNIVTKKKHYPTEFLMTNVYEQLGLCLLEFSKSVDISPDIQQKYKKDGQANLLHAVQLQSETVANDPQFKEAWNAYPTLKELFSDERNK